MNNRFRKSSALLLSAVLLLLPAVPAAAAFDEAMNNISIRSEADLAQLVQSCSLDVWSQNKTITLTADINLTEEFTPIPTFGGTFNGAGHTISSLNITRNGTMLGFIRTVQRGAMVENLNLTGTINPGGTANMIGSFAGENKGTIQNCTFYGTISGNASVGGIVGQNQETGQVIACKSAGVISATNWTGGIAGRNLGTLLKCINVSSINTRATENTISLDQIDISSPVDKLTEAMQDLGNDTFDDAPLNNRTNIGGIAGYSSGIVQSCTNSGIIGYQHIGYNVGGIVGRQTGYLSGCRNNGMIYGRKDVGGIAGQAEPYILLSPGSSKLDELRDELDTLNSMVDRMLDHVNNSSDTISARLTAIGDQTDSARDSSKTLLDQVSDFADDNIDTINTLSVALTDALDKISPALDDITDASDKFGDICDQLGDVLDALDEAAGTTGDASDEMQAATDDLRDAISSFNDASLDVEKAIEDLQNAVVISDPDAAQAAMTALQEGITELISANQQIASALSTLLPYIQDIITGSFPSETTAEITAALEQLQEGVTAVSDALGKINPALADLFAQISLDPNAANAGFAHLADALDDLQSAFDSIDNSLSSISDAFGDLSSMTDDLQNALDRLQKVTDSANDTSDLLSSACEQIGDAVDRLRDDAPYEFVPLGDAVRESSDNLFDSLSGIADNLASLNNEVKDTSDTLTADIRAINNQFQLIFNLLIDTINEVKDTTAKPDIDDILDDTSDKDISQTRTGKITGCINSGIIEGDRNVGGIVGSMAIEYDLDPEDDSTLELNYNSTYETKAVLMDSTNRGTVTAKKDSAGGLVGRMDLGTVLNCSNYGSIESTDGDYVGGVAGFSSGTIRSSCSKANLKGGSYIGGIAGIAKTIRNCFSIAAIEDGDEWVGAIAGSADCTTGRITENYFVDTGKAAIDGISYAGCAQSITHEALVARSDVPRDFAAFTITLVADEKVVATIPFLYGQDLSRITLPEVPEMEGYYGEWPEYDTTGLQSDFTLTAEYYPWVTLLASDLKDGKLSVALADGMFKNEAELHAEESVIAPPEKPTKRTTVSEWDISIRNSELNEGDSTQIRLLCDAKKATVYQYVNNSWQEVETVKNGRYLTLGMLGTTGTFCVVSHAEFPIKLVAAAGAAAALLALTTALGIKFRKKRIEKRKQLAAPNSNPALPENGTAAEPADTAAK